MKGRLRSGTKALGMSKVIGRSRLPCPPTSTTARIAGLAYTKYRGHATAAQAILVCPYARPEARTSAESGMMSSPNRVARTASAYTENLTAPAPFDLTVSVVGSSRIMFLIMPK
jgi:hypothetical protein